MLRCSHRDDVSDSDPEQGAERSRLPWDHPRPQSCSVTHQAPAQQLPI